MVAIKLHDRFTGHVFLRRQNSVQQEQASKDENDARVHEVKVRRIVGDRIGGLSGARMAQHPFIYNPTILSPTILINLVTSTEVEGWEFPHSTKQVILPFPIIL
jgi:hypothetical protein